MSVVKRLQSLNLPEDAMITLTREEGTDVFVHNETEVEDAMNETSVINDFASLIANTKLDARNHWSGNIIQHLRDNDFLEEYQRGSFALTATVKVPFTNFVEINPFVAGWNISVETENGTLSFDA